MYHVQRGSTSTLRSLMQCGQLGCHRHDAKYVCTSTTKVTTALSTKTLANSTQDLMASSTTTAFAPDVFKCNHSGNCPGCTFVHGKKCHLSVGKAPFKGRMTDAMLPDRGDRHGACRPFESSGIGQSQKCQRERQLHVQGKRREVRLRHKNGDTKGQCESEERDVASDASASQVCLQS